MTTAAPTPDVSVVLPTWNRVDFLGASLASLLAEEGVALEVVVVDDGSTDGTAAFLANHPDPRVRGVMGPHAGIAVARNAGIRAARAPIVAFHDSDDRALPGRLSVPVGYLRAHPDVDLVIQNGLMEGPTPALWIPPERAAALAAAPVGVGEVFRWNLGQLQGMCFTRRALDAVGPLDRSFKILDDLDLVLRVAARFRAVFLDRVAFAYRVGGGVARDRMAVREESIRLADKLIREHPEVLSQLGGDAAFRRRQARRWARLGAMRRAAGDRAGARDAVGRARALRPWDLRYALRALWLAAGGRG